MIIYCDSSGVVSSIPSTVPVGTILKDVTIIAPTNTAVAMFRIKPPSGKLLKPIYCSLELTAKRDIVYKANIPKEVTSKAGRADYQISFTTQDGKTLPTMSGTFNVARGVEVDLPETGEDLGSYSLEDIHRLLTNATALYANVNNLHIDLETVLREVGLDDGITLPDVFDNVIDGLRKVDTAIGRQPLETESKSLSQAINELLGYILECKEKEEELKDEHTATLTKHTRDIESIVARLDILESKA